MEGILLFIIRFNMGKTVSYTHLDVYKRQMVTQLKDEDGSVIYLDNYMSYVYHSEAKQWIEEAIGSVFDDFWVYFPIPRGTFDINPDRFRIEDYLREEQADLNITVLIFGETANDENLEALINSFAQKDVYKRQP